MTYTGLANHERIFLSMLIASQVEYLVIGGHAVAYHGYPRPVADLDIWITTGTLNAKKIVTVLHKYGFGLADEESESYGAAGGCNIKRSL